jgi:propanol-preferring alcohol dehydrogenase
VEACGVCHSDVITILWVCARSRIPGCRGTRSWENRRRGRGRHRWSIGQRVGVGYLGGPDFECVPCRRGDFVNCLHQPVTGVTTDGGYAEVMFASERGLVAVPDELTPLDAAPLVCAGVTAYTRFAQFGRAVG